MRAAHLPPAHLLAPPLAAPADLQLRLAQIHDLDALLATCYAHQDRAQFQYHAHRVLTWQASGRAYWLLAERQQQLVGSGELLRYPHGAELASLYVVPPHRGRGVGTALIIVLIRLGRHLGLAELEIGVAPENARAHALYRQLGFRQDREVRLPDGHTAVIMHRRL